VGTVAELYSLDGHQMAQELNTSLTTGDKVKIAVQWTLLAIPNVGSSLERFVFGALAELESIGICECLDLNA
jgi:hypothetical protein